MKPALQTLGNLVVSPKRAFSSFFEKPNIGLRQALWIYAAYLVASALFHGLKPADFPAEDIPSWAGVSAGEGVGYWVRVQLWNPVLMMISLFFTVVYGVLLEGRFLAVRMLAGGGILGVPLLMVIMSGRTQIPVGGVLAVWALLLALGVWIARKVSRDTWRNAGAVLLAIHGIGLLMVPALALATAIRVALAYRIVEFGMAFWTVGLATIGLAGALKLHTARAFCTLLLATFAQIVFWASLRIAGLLPETAVRAILAG